MPIVRLPNGDLRDEIRQALFDTLQATGADAITNPNNFNNRRFFDLNNTAGWATNLRQKNSLETAVSYRVQGMAIDGQYVNFDPLVIANSYFPMLMDFGSLVVHIGEKDYWTGCLTYIMGRIEQNGAVAYSPATVVPAVNTPGFVSGLAYQRAGMTAVQGVVLSGRHVIDINPLQSFYATLQVAVPPIQAAAASCKLGPNDLVNLKFSFKGLQRRPVQ